MATSTFNFDPEGAGSIIIGNRNVSSGGYTSLSLSITNDKGGKAYIQCISASGSNWGDLQLNPFGGFVSIPTISPAPKDVSTMPLVIDPKTGRIYYKSS
jgi:hypothetical protein